MHWHWPAESHWLLMLPWGSQPQPISSGIWPSPEVEGSHSWNPKPATKHPHFNHPWASNSPLQKELFISQPLLCVGILRIHSGTLGWGLGGGAFTSPFYR